MGTGHVDVKTEITRSFFGVHLHVSSPRITLTPYTIGDRSLVMAKFAEHDVALTDADGRLNALENGVSGTALPYNGDVVALLPGMPVALVGDSLRRASASSQVLSRVVGVVAQRAEPTLPVILADDDLTLSDDEWLAVTGESGLMPGAKYLLGTALGTLSTTAPSADGQTLLMVGWRSAPNNLSIQVGEPILL
jgi:hypothetical protein